MVKKRIHSSDMAVRPFWWRIGANHRDRELLTLGKMTECRALGMGSSKVGRPDHSERGKKQRLRIAILNSWFIGKAKPIGGNWGAKSNDFKMRLIARNQRENFTFWCIFLVAFALF